MCVQFTPMGKIATLAVNSLEKVHTRSLILNLDHLNLLPHNPSLALEISQIKPCMYVRVCVREA